VKKISADNIHTGKIKTKQNTLLSLYTTRQARITIDAFNLMRMCAKLISLCTAVVCHNCIATIFRPGVITFSKGVSNQRINFRFMSVFFSIFKAIFSENRIYSDEKV
jgi:hypothetical protein